MFEWLIDNLKNSREQLHLLLRQYINLGRPFLLRSDLWDTYQNFCSQQQTNLCDDAFRRIVRNCQEAAVESPWLFFALRETVGRWVYFSFHLDTMEFNQVDVSEFLAFKERLVTGQDQHDKRVLEVDFHPFTREFPMLKEPRSIGRGVEFLNRRLSSQLFHELGRGDKRLLDFLRVHQYQGQQLMLNDRIGDVTSLRRAVRRAIEYLSEQEQATGWTDVNHYLQSLGFEIGWGDSIVRIKETLLALSDILEAPDPDNLERFLGRVPMIFKVAILSPHGFFGQSNVLGLPDTGGQVVYILDQVRALEREMRMRISQQGLEIEPQIIVVTRLIPDARGTTCDQPVEHIAGTENAKIVRVPFRGKQGEIIEQWISRFEIWPYLERFSVEVGKELVVQLGGRPDLIVGNYSDGNLVATLIAQKLNITQCNIAHALEKTKYILSDLYWKDHEEQHHFSCQFTADLIAMNAADFIITSTYQEIAGNEQSVGQYEAHGAFTMPDLYRVVKGVEIYDPKFNIVSPGADADVYYPYSDESRRLRGLHQDIHEFIYGGARDDSRGILADADKPVIFTMARLDTIKNITGLVKWFAESNLREFANLLVVAGYVDVNSSDDDEERAQISLMHELMNTHNLDPHVRWVGCRLDKTFAGELYRYIADRQGIFVQPALFEAFGLTVIEAMSCGLPTFATCFGGPLEIIHHGVSGFHIDPNHGERVAQQIANFFDRCKTDDTYWRQISNAGIQRVQQRYTWELYAERMMTLSRIYGFWKFVTEFDREDTRRYLEMFYNLQFKPLANKLEQAKID